MCLHSVSSPPFVEVREMPGEVAAGLREVAAAGLGEGISSNQRAERPTYRARRPTYRAQRPCGTTSVWHNVRVAQRPCGTTSVEW